MVFEGSVVDEHMDTPQDEECVTSERSTFTSRCIVPDQPDADDCVESWHATPTASVGVRTQWS